jgi:uncharacterized protein involved in exopolysaccharide biosynthesis
LLQRVNEFNIETRKSQASAERHFVETQAASEEQALRDAEDRLQTWLERNRVATSPELIFERDRLQREVGFHEQLYTSRMLSLDDARTREIRDTPVITILDAPRLPSVGMPRRSIQMGAYGALAGAALGMLIAFIAQGWNRGRRAQSADAREFFHALGDMVPRFLKK